MGGMRMILLLIAAVLVQESEAKDVLRGLRDAFSRAKALSIQFEVEARVTNAGAETVKRTGSGRLLLKDGNKAFVQTTFRGETAEQLFQLRSDGDHLMYEAGDSGSKSGKVERRDGLRRTPELLNLVLGDAWLGGSLVMIAYEASGGGTAAKGFDVSVLESPVRPRISDVASGGDDGDRKTLTYKLHLGERVLDLRMWYDPKTKGIVKREIREKSEREELVLIESFTRVSLDADLGDAEFSLSKPKAPGK